MLRLALTVGLLLFSSLALAQDGGDGGLPEDAGSDGGPVSSGDGGSQGEGGSDRDNPEGDDRGGRVVTLCNSSAECTRGFTCQDGHCVWNYYRDATGGFCGAVSASLFLAGVVLLGRGRRSRS